MYGLYGLKHHILEISRAVTDAGRTDEQTTSEDRATQLLICEPLSLAILYMIQSNHVENASVYAYTYTTLVIFVYSSTPVDNVYALCNGSQYTSWPPN